MSREQLSPPAPRMLFISLGVLVLIFFAGGYKIYRHEAKAVQTEKYNEMKAIADLKVRQIVSWRQEREADARIHSTGLVRTTALQWLKDPNALPAMRTELQNRLQVILEYQGYDNIILADTDGRILLTLDTGLTVLEPGTQRLAAQVASSNNVVFGDFFRCPVCHRIHLDVAAPIPGEDNLPVAVLILRTDPTKYLYPLIQTWPLPSKSAETLLIRRDGDDILFLNTLRHRSDPALTIRIPISRADLPAAQAALGQTGIFPGRDYRGVDVLTDIRPVPGSTWFMVAKEDTNEILAEVRYHGMVIGFFTLMLALLAGTSAGYIYKHQGKRAFQDLYQTERDRRKAVEEFRTTLYSIGDAVITTDVNGSVRQMNPVAEHLTGWMETDAKGKPVENIFRIISEATAEPAESPVQKVLEKGSIIGLANHTLLVSKNGIQTPIADSGAPIRDESGDITGVVLVFRDQTIERDIDRLLRSRLNLLEYAADNSLENLLQKTVDEACSLTNSPVGFFHFVGFDQKNLTLQAWSTRTIQEFCKAKGKGMHYPVEQAGVWVDCVHTKEPVIHNNYELLPHKKGLPEGHTPVIREMVVPIMRSGRIVAILGVGNKSLDYTQKDTEIVYHIADMAWEIAEHKRTERDRLLLADTINASLNEVFILDAETWRFRYVNQGALKNLGYTLAQMQEMTPLDIKPEVTAEDFRELLQPLINNEKPIQVFNTVHRRADGSDYPVEVHIQIFNHEGDRVFLAVIQDISTKKSMEDQLRQAQKMESVGRLAGGVAHDFNNMLMVIIGYTEMVLEQVDPGLAIFKDLQEVLNAAKRSKDLTRQLLAFARKQTISPRILDLNDTITSMLKLLRQLIGEDIDLAWKPGLDTWPVKLDPAQIDQMLANLLVNAKDAIGGVGSVTIETDNMEFDEDYCANHVGFLPGKYVMLAVSDTGAGMDKETLDLIFEPFFTTKEMGKGTGLGLATVFGIVKQNDGFINVYSEPGQGTTFRIYLPRTESGVEEEAILVSNKNLQGTETVLLVEDEESILKLGASILKQYGYIVLTAKNPSEALALATNYDGTIHLLVTDVVMPGMNGKDLNERLAALRPGIKSVFMSGYTANAIAHHGVLDEGVHFLQKPFPAIHLAEKVREVLDGE